MTRRGHVVRYQNGRALVDRGTLARLLGRSVHTIRARCTPAATVQGRPVYDADECARILAAIPTRRRRPS